MIINKLYTLGFLIVVIIGSIYALICYLKDKKKNFMKDIKKFIDEIIIAGKYIVLGVSFYLLFFIIGTLSKNNYLLSIGAIGFLIIMSICLYDIYERNSNEWKLQDLEDYKKEINKMEKA